MSKIGIICDNVTQPWVDGADQNAYFLYKILKKLKFEVEIVSFYREIKFFGEKVLSLTYSKINNYDFFINCSKINQDDIINQILAKNKKVILNIHHNLMMNEFEAVNNKELGNLLSKFNFNNSYKIWTQEAHSDFSSLLSTISRTEVETIPFLWDPDFLIENDNGYHKVCDLKSKEQLKKVGTLESNYNFYKTAIIPMGIAEGLNSTNPSLIEKFHMGSMAAKLENKMFKNFYDRLEITRSKKIVASKRFPMHLLISNDLINTFVAHQVCNENNYYYLEALFYKRPLIHNSNSFKDIGYFYNEFDAKEGSKQLKNAILNFDYKNHEESYLKKIEKHSTDNKNNQEKVYNMVKELLWEKKLV